MSTAGETKRVDVTVQLRELQTLQLSAAWRQLAGVIQEQVDALQNRIIFGEVKAAEDLYMIERLKGQLEGRLSLSLTLETLLETLETDLKLIQTAEE
jgi:hypothetical protein